MAYSISNQTASFQPYLKDWIKTYDDIITFEQCDKYIKLFDLMESFNATKTLKETYRKCITFPDLEKQLQPYEEFKKIMNKVIAKYRADTGNDILNFVTMLESPNIIKYLPQTDNEFHRHADTWSMDSASRQLSIIVYLNDVEKGGATNFTDIGISIQPKKGRILVFPPFYNFAHAGESPISNAKYIIVTWFHFHGTGHKYTVSNIV